MQWIENNGNWGSNFDCFFSSRCSRLHGQTAPLFLSGECPDPASLRFLYPPLVVRTRHVSFTALKLTRLFSLGIQNDRYDGPIAVVEDLVLLHGVAQVPHRPLQLPHHFSRRSPQWVFNNISALSGNLTINQTIIQAKLPTNKPKELLLPTGCKSWSNLIDDINFLRLESVDQND